jgi:tRNA(Ile)-lysidine synthase
MADNRHPFPNGFTPFDKLSGMSPSEPVLVAFSGGADSRALFDLTARYCRESGSFFYACHVNHGIRGDEAIRDKDFCIAVAKACPECKDIFVLDADVPAMAKISGRSLELEARLVRYDFFNNIMKEKGLSILATAHNADDNLETLIFNMTRGSGAKGMCGIPRVRKFDGGLIVRPILDMTKSEILGYCRENRLDFVTDSTNECTDYSRNLIRAKIIPLLEELNPEVRRSAARLSDSMKELCHFAENESDRYDLSIGSLHSAPTALLPIIFGRAASETGCGTMLESVHVAALRELCEKGKNGSSVSLPDSTRGVIRNGRLVFEPDTGRTDPLRSDENYEIALTSGENLLPPGCKISIGDAFEDNGELSVTLDGNMLTSPLIARNRRKGDKILSGGMHKSVKKLMCDKKVPTELRSSLPILCDSEGILWIPGVAVRDGVLSKKGSLKIKFSK